MNVISPVRSHLQSNRLKPVNVSFGDDKTDQVINTVSDVAKKFEAKPDENVIKSGLKSLFELISSLFSKNSAKIKAFIDNNSESKSRFKRALAFIAGGLMSILSVLGGSDLFKDKVSEMSKEKEVKEDEGKVKEDKGKGKEEDIEVQ